MGLVHFGFTKTQQAVYGALLTRGEATGYLLARDTRLARANVYQALDVLVARGLATAAGDRPVRYRATSASRAMALLRERTEGELASLAAELGVPDTAATGRGPVGEAGWIDAARALRAAASAATDAAEHEVLAVVGPWAGEFVRALGRARQRGLSCRVVSLGAPAPEGAALRPIPAKELAPYWGGLPILVVCDRAHAVCGVLDGERASGVDTRSAGLVPFLRHLLRREFASVTAPRLP